MSKISRIYLIVFFLHLKDCPGYNKMTLTCSVLPGYCCSAYCLNWIAVCWFSAARICILQKVQRQAAVLSGFVSDVKAPPSQWPWAPLDKARKQTILQILKALRLGITSIIKVDKVNILMSVVNIVFRCFFFCNTNRHCSATNAFRNRRVEQSNLYGLCELIAFG